MPESINQRIVFLPDDLTSQEIRPLLQSILTDYHLPPAIRLIGDWRKEQLVYRSAKATDDEDAGLTPANAVPRCREGLRRISR